MILDSITNAARYYSLNPLFEKAFDYLKNTDLTQVAIGRYELVPDALYANISEYETKEPVGELMEAHKKFIDIQYLVSGTERMGIAMLNSQPVTKAYDEEKDFHLFQDAPDFFISLKTDEFVIFYPTDLHLPNISLAGKSFVKKVVMKVLVSE